VVSQPKADPPLAENPTSGSI